MFRNEKAFTLIEMLIVLLIITVLIILIIPNLTGRSEDVHQKGCDALVSVVQAQIHLYHLEVGNLPDDLATLVTAGYITEDQTTCQNDKALKYDKEKGEVEHPDETN